tara:strand:- start:2064 stop:2981 length:918 start_codon:yes stop_codon:yes gene_type:complete
MSEETNETLEQIEDEIKETQRKAGKEEDFEIEIVDAEDAGKSEDEENTSEDDEYGPKVQRRIKKLVAQRREAELQARKQQEETSQLQARLNRLEQGSETNVRHQAEHAFHNRYMQTRQALAKAVEEGDTEAQLDFTEQIADMRAAVRVAESQKSQQAQQRQQQRPQETNPRARQAAETPPPEKAMGWWQTNRWFNASGFERETAAARAIDVQLDLEGFDKNSDDYYGLLNNRLRDVFPELELGGGSKQKPKSRSPVAPTAGGSSAYKGNRIRLSNEQLRMARELGITDESGLKKYESEIRQQNRS